MFSNARHAFNGFPKWNILNPVAKAPAPIKVIFIPKSCAPIMFNDVMATMMEQIKVNNTKEL